MHTNTPYGYPHYGAHYTLEPPISESYHSINSKQHQKVPPPPQPQTILFNPKFMVNKVFVNPNFNQQTAATTIHINPRLNLKNNYLPPESTKIHINPNTKRLQMPFVNQQKHSVHLNPKHVPKCVQMPVIDQQCADKKAPIPSASSERKENIPFVLTKTKLIRAPQNPSKIQKKERRNSIKSKYKIIKSGLKVTPRNKFKIDKRIPKLVPKNMLVNLSTLVKTTIIKKNASSVVNISGIIYKKSKNSLRRASIGGSSIKEQSSKRRIISKSQYKLINKSISPGKKIVADARNKRKILQSQYKLINKSITALTKNKNLGEVNRQFTRRKILRSQYKLVNKSHSPIKKNKKLVVGEVRMFKIVRHQSPNKKKKDVKMSGRKFKKCNIPCLTFRKYGLCRQKNMGKCPLKHDPDQVALCTRFLQGACLKENCLLSHSVFPEKMPTCKYYLEGDCSKENCPYLHVKISPKAEVCHDFLEGFCKKAAQCEKRHQYLCPDYEKYGKCVKQRCQYPHGKMVRNYLINKNQFAKKCSKTNDLTSENKNNIVETSNEGTDEEDNARYYVENDSKPEEDIIKKEIANNDAVDGRKNSNLEVNFVGSNGRPQLGSLPAFISFGES